MHWLHLLRYISTISLNLFYTKWTSVELCCVTSHLENITKAETAIMLLYKELVVSMAILVKVKSYWLLVCIENTAAIQVQAVHQDGSLIKFMTKENRSQEEYKSMLLRSLCTFPRCCCLCLALYVASSLARITHKTNLFVEVNSS